MTKNITVIEFFNKNYTYEETDKFYIFEDNNKYYKNFAWVKGRYYQGFSEEEAIKANSTLDNCFNCVNLSFSSNVTDGEQFYTTDNTKESN